jgi:hypothetical protein
MSMIKFFVEYHSGRRQPNLEFWLNGQQLTATTEWQNSVSQNQTNAIVAAECELLDHNCLEIWQRDKTDSDLVQHHEQWIDHWCKIQEIEIDGVRCQTALYRCTEFEHAMSADWVNHMASQGHIIPAVYRPGGTDIRLNGCCRMHFTTPVWQWYVTHYDNESTH